MVSLNLPLLTFMTFMNHDNGMVISNDGHTCSSVNMHLTKLGLVLEFVEANLLLLASCSDLLAQLSC